MYAFDKRQLIRLLTTSVRSLPVVAPVGLTTFGVVAMVLLLLNQFYLPLLLLFGLPIAALAMWLMFRFTAPDSEQSRQPLTTDLVAVLGIILWAIINIPFSAQHILTDRDPATYAVAGAWLATHHDLHIPVLTAFSRLPSMTAASFGFNLSALQPNEIYAQGAHLLPALLGVAGKVFGQAAMLHFNVLFGAVALLAFYGFARQVLKPTWSIMATAALALSLPFIFFSRDTYTEPLTLMIVFSTLTLLMYGVRTKREMLWLLAGIVAGASTLLRIDTYVFLAAIEVFCLWYLAYARQNERKSRLLQVISLAGPAFLLGILGWLDVSQLSSGYYRDLNPQIVSQFYFIGGLSLTGCIAVAIAWRTSLARSARRLVQNKQCSVGLQVALGLFFIALMLRALWYLALAVTGRAQTMPVVEYSYGTTILWILWYIGPLLGALGVIGFIYGWARLMQGKMSWMLPFFIVLTAECALYLVHPLISPDQIWASRRFLPIIFPGFIILGVMVLQHTTYWLEQHANHRTLYRKLIIVAVIIGLLGPALTSLPFWDVRPYAELPLMQGFCQRLPRNALIVWVGQEGGYATQPTQAFCGVASLSTTAQGASLRLLARQIATVSTRTGYTPYFAASAADGPLLAGMGPLQTTKPLTYVEPEHTYKKFPTHTISHTVSFVWVRIHS